VQQPHPSLACSARSRVSTPVPNSLRRASQHATSHPAGLRCSTRIPRRHPASRIKLGSVQALAPAPGELTLQPPHRSRLTRSTQAAGHQDQGEPRRGFGRIRHRCALLWRFYLFVSCCRRPRALLGC
jgi:hypothetical protein